MLGRLSRSFSRVIESSCTATFYRTNLLLNFSNHHFYWKIIGLSNFSLYFPYLRQLLTLLILCRPNSHLHLMLPRNITEEVAPKIEQAIRKLRASPSPLALYSFTVTNFEFCLSNNRLYWKGRRFPLGTPQKSLTTSSTFLTPLLTTAKLCMELMRQNKLSQQCTRRAILLPTGGDGSLSRLVRLPIELRLNHLYR